MLFDRKGGKTEEADGKVIVNIQIDKITRKEREVSIKIFERGREETVFKMEYLTSQSETFAYYRAKDHVNQFIEDNDYIVEVEHTNAQLPFVRNVDKRMR